MIGKANTEADFRSQVDKRPGGCWVWTNKNADTHNGYGHFAFRNQRCRAHRLAYELLRGPIPEGMQIDHLCRNRACVNPDHMEIVDNRTNTLRGNGPTANNARKTHCLHGHPFSGANLYISARGDRNCRTCHRLRHRIARHRHCYCGHTFELHLPTCTEYLGKGKPGADAKGFCKCARFRLKGRRR